LVSLARIDSGGGNEYSRDPLMVLAVLTLAGVPRDTHGRYFRSVLVGFGNFERPWSYFREGQEVPINPVSALPNPLGGRLGNPYLEVVIGSIY
jgi:hypothetical protein